MNKPAPALSTTCQPWLFSELLSMLEQRMVEGASAVMGFQKGNALPKESLHSSFFLPFEEGDFS